MPAAIAWRVTLCKAAEREAGNGHRQQVVSQFRQPELSGKKGRRWPIWGPAWLLCELAVIKISADSGLMHEMMARRRMILGRDLAMVVRVCPVHPAFETRVCAPIADPSRKLLRVSSDHEYFNSYHRYKYFMGNG